MRPKTPSTSSVAIHIMSAGLRGNGAIAVLREAKSKWERRSPITPDHVASLVKSGVRVLVQPCETVFSTVTAKRLKLTLWTGTHRVFTDSQFIAAGAAMQEDVSPASVILGVKEVPVDLLIPNRTSAPRAFASRVGFSSLVHGRYMFFGHVIKAQPHRCLPSPQNQSR
jgi:hypothetical protein